MAISIAEMVLDHDRDPAGDARFEGARSVVGKGWCHGSGRCRIAVCVQLVQSWKLRPQHLFDSHSLLDYLCSSVDARIIRSAGSWRKFPPDQSYN